MTNLVELRTQYINQHTRNLREALQEQNKTARVWTIPALMA
jgi:hypothetical protein